MEKQHIRIFRLALLPLALTLALPAFADNSELETVNVQGKSSARAPVTSKTIARSTAVSLRDTLRDETGVQFGGGQGSTSQWVSIRGVAEDQIDIVVDNANAGDTPVFHHQSRMALDPALVKIIGVDKGTGSASAGIGATSGRIRATTLDAADLLKPGRNVGARINGGVLPPASPAMRALTRSICLPALISPARATIKTVRATKSKAPKQTAKAIWRKSATTSTKPTG